MSTDIQRNVHNNENYIMHFRAGVMVMVFSATFNNISAISWRSILLVEKTGEPGENHRHPASQTQHYHDHDQEKHLLC